MDIYAIRDEFGIERSTVGVYGCVFEQLGNGAAPVYGRMFE